MAETTNTRKPANGVYGVLGTVNFPARNTKFRLEDFFQTDVDDFRSGDFMFISADIVKIKCNKHIWKDCEAVDKFGWVIKTYCYTYKTYWNILICNYKSKPWHNHYHIEGNIASSNGCHGYCLTGDIKDFIEWMEFS